MKKLYIFSLFLVLFSCSGDKEEVQMPRTTCDQATIVNSTEYTNAVANIASIESLQLNSNCMLVNLSDSGCNGNSWTYKLVTDGVVNTTTTPVSRKLKLQIFNPEMCLAVFKKTRSFDIENLKVSGQNSVKLIVEYSNNQTKEITYNY